MKDGIKTVQNRLRCLSAGTRTLTTLGKKFRCKICDSELLDKEHLERHYKVHSKPKPTPYGDPYFPQPMWSAVEGAYTPRARVLFGKTEEDKKRKKKSDKRE